MECVKFILLEVIIVMKKSQPKVTSVPLYRNTAFHLVDIPTMQQAFQNEDDYSRSPELYIYSRYRNPTVAHAESQIMAIEGSGWSLLTQSGLSAIDVALSIFQEKGCNANWLFFSEIYGGTNQFIDSVLVNRRNFNVHRFQPNGNEYSISQFEEVLKELKPKVVFFETVSNPMLIVANGPAIIQKAKDFGAKVIVDNTFTTPFLWKPLEAGADIVIHSATKYLAGHGTISAGVLSGNDEELEKLALEYRKLVGHMISPDDAARLSEQLKTFSLRVQRQFENASALANFLSNHAMIDGVLYPGLQSHPTHLYAKDLFKDKGYGAVITFDIAGENRLQKEQRCQRFIAFLQKHIPLLPTLGDADTILMPIEPVWGDRYPFPGMIRLSVGIEDTEELIATIDSALEEIAKL